MKKELFDKLKKEKDTAVLAHYYVDEEIQKLADYIGDSFYLAQLATNLKEKNIVMAGVYFMGESIKIINPEKNVHMVNIKADCPMAHMVTVDKIKEMKSKIKDLAVVCYINSTAEIKAYSDVCVTSSNVVKIVKSLPEKNIFFIPDGNLARYVATKIPEKNIIPNDGYCPVHNDVTVEKINAMKRKHKNALILAHPECREEVLAIADYIGSTSGIIENAGLLNSDEFIIVTEQGIGYELKIKYPEKIFYFVENMICDDMKYSDAEQLFNIVEKGGNEVFVDEEIAKEARKPLEKMLTLGA